ncbi:hypothetical protein RDI58_026013 [Solanum bulbocastanum]|uniref:Uncharacterized protein n=1 Tax=Solanum bulbocastanum TaxID=147425 RepID=A0AAN8SVJ7_SOLBU
MEDFRKTLDAYPL